MLGQYRLGNTRARFYPLGSADHGLIGQQFFQARPEAAFQNDELVVAVLGEVFNFLALDREGTGPAPPSRELLERITDLAEKDLGHSIACGRSVGLRMPGAEVCRDRMARVYGLVKDDEPGSSA